MSLHIRDKVNILDESKAKEDWQESFKLSIAKSPYSAKICFWPLITHLRKRALNATGVEKMFVDHALKLLRKRKDLLVLSIKRKI